MDDAVSVAVVKGTGNLAGKLASLLFLETAVRDDVIEHLTAIDKLKHHVPMEVCPDDIFHAADIRVAEEADNGGLSGGADFFGVVGSLTISSALMLILRLARHNLDGGLEEGVVSRGGCMVNRRNMPMGQANGRGTMWAACKGTHLFSSFDVLGELDLAHAAGTDCLA